MLQDFQSVSDHFMTLRSKELMLHFINTSVFPDRKKKLYFILVLCYIIFIYAFSKVN